MAQTVPVQPDGPDDRPEVFPARPDDRRLLIVREDARGGDTSWMPLAACRGSDPELFFPISATGKGLEEINAAKAVCRRCPVRRPCLSYALRTVPDGIWGGATREERSARRTRPAAGSRADW